MKFTYLVVLLVAIVLTGFKDTEGIDECFISFNIATALKVGQTDRLPATAEKFRTIKTEVGEKTVTREDGYRVLYNNEKNVPFVSLKVELSATGSYETDQLRLLENLAYLNAHSIGMETKDLITLRYNGYTITGLSRGTIEDGSTLGTFVMFPGNNVTVYFYFNNLKPGFRNFESVEEYKGQRDRFMQEYTKHLANCVRTR